MLETPTYLGASSKCDHHPNNQIHILGKCAVPHRVANQQESHRCCNHQALRFPLTTNSSSP